MSKHLKLNIKNAQIAEAIDLKGLKNKLAKKNESPAAPKTEHEAAPKEPKAKAHAKTAPKEAEEPVKPAEATPAPRVRARSKSVFAETHEAEAHTLTTPPEKSEITAPKAGAQKTSEELRREIFGEEVVEAASAASIEEKPAIEVEVPPSKQSEPRRLEPRKIEAHREPSAPDTTAERVKLGPTGRHVKDLLPPPTTKPEPQAQRVEETRVERESTPNASTLTEEEGQATKKGGKGAAFKEFRDLKPSRKTEGQRTFDARDRHGLRDGEEEQRWRKKRLVKKRQEEIPTVRPTTLAIRVPISIKDLAVEMKLKASQLVSKLFLQGVIVTLNDLLDDETTIQLLGQEFGCEITLDTSEARRIQITDKTVKEEITQTEKEQLSIRPPVVAFMGHVDHGKTSLIDAIRKSNRASGEAGAITQHIGAFRCHTAVGDISILDTPGHEAFSAMRARGADVTDIVVLVVAGDEGIRQQTLEAIQHAKAANVTLVVAINKSDKPNFNPENVYRQLSENELLPEVWGGQVLTVNCSALTGAGVKELLEMLALQAEVLELRADSNTRARGTVLESEMHKGMGAVTTVLVQNGTLKVGDALVFGQYWGRVKTMQDDLGRNLAEASPSTPVAITGLSGLPEAGQEFIVVKNEREAREISEARVQGFRQSLVQQKKSLTVENLLQQATPSTKKILNLILRADVQGSLEALKVALQKIESDKAEVNIVFTGVGEVSESDIQLASTSKAVVLGFHTKTESHAESLIKQLSVQVRHHDIIYHAIDDIKALMTGLLDRIAQETTRGKVEVKALFKSSQAGVIAGCMVIDGSIQRSYHIRVLREGTEIGKAPIASLKRVKEDVREVHKGQECGIALTRFTDIQQGDILEAYEITYITQEL